MGSKTVFSEEMVGFDPNRKEQGKGLSSFQCGFCGAVSGVITRLVVQPLDVLKIRFQLQIEPTTKGIITGKYSGIWQAFKLIYKEEGYASLWKGHVPAQVLSVVYGYVQFMAFEAITEAVWKTYPNSTSPRWKPVTHFVCGGVAGCLAATVAQPLDVLRTRLVAQGEPKIYKNLHDATFRMYRNEGLRSFYKGLVPTLVQIFPHAGLQFGFYAFFKALWEMALHIKKKDPYQPADVEESLVCGALSGICSKGIIYPLDMVKKRLQVQGFQEARETFGRVQKYNSMVNCFKVVVKEEGATAFFKGLTPSTVKAGLSVALIFCTYEQCLTVVRGYIHDDEVPVATPASSR